MYVLDFTNNSIMISNARIRYDVDNIKTLFHIHNTTNDARFIMIFIYVLECLAIKNTRC